MDVAMKIKPPIHVCFAKTKIRIINNLFECTSVVKNKGANDGSIGAKDFAATVPIGHGKATAS